MREVHSPMETSLVKKDRIIIALQNVSVWNPAGTATTF